MKTFILMRHAEADTGYRDKDRPLTERGRRQAQETGLKLAGAVGAVDVLFISDAVRTQQTLAGLRSGGLNVSRVEVEPYLYNGGVEDVFRLLANADDDALTLMVLGHEPTMSYSSFALRAPDGGEGFRHGFPTAGAIIFEGESVAPASLRIRTTV